MPRTSADSNPREALKRELQSSASPSQLEKLSAALLSHLLGLPIIVARAGFQYGADAGSAGEQNRRLRLECKRYKDSTNLNERELLGEVDQALCRDEALEAWILIATCSVPEQIQQSLIQHGEKNGIPIVILDWSDNANVPLLAALCACNPSLVRELFSEEAAIAATALQPISADATETLRRNLQSWHLGFESLRAASHERLSKMWNSSQAAQTLFMQNVAGGEKEKKIKRALVHKSLDSWWYESAENLSPAIITGLEGVGKTWATVNWLVDSISELPIILAIPSSAISSVIGLSEIGVKQLLADSLYQISGTRNQKHWLERLNRLLEHPSDEGPVLLVFFDGLNQNPLIDWLAILKIFQSELFATRIQIICSTRKHYYEERLLNLRGLPVSGTQIYVSPFGIEPGGELDQMLEFEDLEQSDLPSDVIELARKPRLFGLVVYLKEALKSPGQITIHRILWEYGRDTLGESSERTFSTNAWKEFLKEIATHYRNGIREYSHQSLGETVNCPDLSVQQVYARLSSIVDGQFATRSESGDWQIAPAMVAQALGVGLLHHLDKVDPSNHETLNNALAKWLEPIAGLDEQVEILRAAVSILIAQNRASEMPVSGTLITGWLQSQNLADEHFQEIVDLASNFPEALLVAIEQSGKQAQTSARNLAVKALRTIPRSDTETLDCIAEYTCRWVKIVSLGNDVRIRQAIDSELGLTADTPSENPNSKWFIKRIGADVPGPIEVAGIDLELVDVASGVLPATVPSIVEGFPLAHFRSLFEVMAVARVITIGEQSECWKGLRWLCLFNKENPDETASMLRDLSEDIRNRTPESNLHPGFLDRISGLLLWLTGQEEDDEAADSLTPRLDSPTYENDYLPDPNRSPFPLERRHAEAFLKDTRLTLGFRIRRIRELWSDPTFHPPTSFIEEIREAATSIDVTKLGRSQVNTDEDFLYRDLIPVLARYAPDLLADLIQRKIRSMGICLAENRHWCAIDIVDDLMLIGEREKEAIKTLRLSGQHENLDIEDQTLNLFLLAEIHDFEALDQFDTLIRNGLKHFRLDLVTILQTPTPSDIDELTARYSEGSAKQQYDLLTLLSAVSVELSDSAWTWVTSFIEHSDKNVRGMAFKALACSDIGRFGQELGTKNWSWQPSEDCRVNHYGSDALAHATLSFSFDGLAHRLAPWRLLEAVRLRGSKPSEVRLASFILDQILDLSIEEPKAGTELSIDCTKPTTQPYSYTVSLISNSNQQFEFILAMNSKQRASALKQALKTAQSNIKEAYQSGASLYLHRIKSEDFELVIQHASDMIQKWVEGAYEISESFLFRVRLAEGTYMALCEALLSHNPKLGMQLWHALRVCIKTRHIGVADIDDLIHMVFRAPDSAEVIALREELVGTKYCKTDRDLFNLALAASHNGKIDWLKAMIERDQSSEIAWHRYRAIVLSGFTINNELPVVGAWPEGRLKSDHARLSHRAARRRWREACARHWWQTFLDASDQDQAYAAWVLFLHSADRRAQLLVYQLPEKQDTLSILKQKQLALNWSRLENATGKHDSQIDGQFLSRDIVDSIDPWVE